MTAATEVRERPILFGAPMVRAILEGRKAQTRRIIGPQPHPSCCDGGTGFHWHPQGTESRYLWDMDMGRLGDRMADEGPWRVGLRLWVRETWGYGGSFSVTRDASGVVIRQGPGIIYRADPGRALIDVIDSRWRSSIHMPRWASRIMLEITGVRVQRLQEISEYDAGQEGAVAAMCSRDGRGADNDRDAWCRWTRMADPEAPVATARGAFAALWESINGKKPGGSWDESPWVWAISFRLMDKAEGGGRCGA